MIHALIITRFVRGTLKVVAGLLGYQAEESARRRVAQALRQARPGRFYGKIIIPSDSALSCSEAWGFMKAVAEKCDYGYQASRRPVLLRACRGPLLQWFFSRWRGWLCPAQRLNRL